MILYNINNILILLIIILIICIILFANNHINKNKNKSENNQREIELNELKNEIKELKNIKENIKTKQISPFNNITRSSCDCPNNLYSIYEDNPYVYMKNPYIDSNKTYDINWYKRDGPRLPNRINYPSQYDNCEFKQIGVLSPNCEYCEDKDCKENCNNNEILPLYAKPSKFNRNNYNYYTLNNGNQNLNLQVPIEYKNRNCMEDNGCNEIYDKDTIKVPVFNKKYNVTLYPYS